MRLESPGVSVTRKGKRASGWSQAAWMLGIGEVMRNLPSDVAACEVRGSRVLEAQGEGAVSCARPPGVVKMEDQGDQLEFHSTEVVVTLR